VRFGVLNSTARLENYENRGEASPARAAIEVLKRLLEYPGELVTHEFAQATLARRYIR
jgi:hypothetical protein